MLMNDRNREHNPARLPAHAKQSFCQKHPVLLAVAVVLCAGFLLTALNTVLIYVLQLHGYTAEVFASSMEIAVGLLLIAVLKCTTNTTLGFTAKGLGEGLLLLSPILALAFFAFESDLSQWVDLGYGPDITLVLVALLEAGSVGFYEELAYRAIIIGGIAQGSRRTRFWTGKAIIGSALLFGGIHIINNFYGYQDLFSTFSQIIYALALGLLFAAAYIRTHNLWACAIAHALVDLGSFLAPGSIAGGYSGAMDVAGTPDATGLILQLAFMAAIFLAYALFVVRPNMQGEIEAVWKER